MTPFQKHVAKWSSCQRCHLCKTRKKVVLCRGALPCDVLFVGEAPGESEDVIGLPFIGPAGKLLDYIIKLGLKDSGLSFALTNIVACIPREEDSTKKATEPSPEEIRSCAPRLQEFIDMAHPRLIVAVGKVAGSWLDKKMYPKLYEIPRDVDVVEIEHPASILRRPSVAQGLMCRKAAVIIAGAIEKAIIPF